MNDLRRRMSNLASSYLVTSNSSRAVTKVTESNIGDGSELVINSNFLHASHFARVGQRRTGDEESKDR
jgi:hypothetical protein